ncbi:type II toxin-antitoxin system RelE/ParE family toxin [Thiohalophilus thiocyanatoxydans]|uniref:Toxin n=1 Tax=Thiohalophilus thiocyanatoxydans TaxID=381308 RepID=A0A4R8IP72_9GAMM|nr:type II toxin-antitoxin system RelE/ParE family toxin [Thiohalophilus thiocyanatoxydans]TDY02711.1 toxin ParE1/3/4 [Thiohalophilus thiocyanatoxydans]
MAYKLSRKAEEDTIAVFVAGIEQFGLLQAERYHDELEKCFQFLAENPKAARERYEITPPVRVHPFESHLIIYTVDEDDDVFIVRVRHGHEDWLSAGYKSSEF